MKHAVCAMPPEGRANDVSSSNCMPAFTVRFLGTAFMFAVLCLSAPRSAESAEKWPQTIRAKEWVIVVYQPQPESYKDEIYTERAAGSVKKAGEREPVFGVIRFSARTEVDMAARMAALTDVKVDAVRFPTLTAAEEKQVSLLVEKESRVWERSPMALDRLRAVAAAAEREKTALERIETKPPVVMFSTVPAMLIVINGDPVLRAAGKAGIMRVVNTPCVILFDPVTAVYFLQGRNRWYTATEIKGRWSVTDKAPAEIVEAANHVAEKVPAEERFPSGKTSISPEVIVVTEPTELIVTEGEPEYSALQGTDLLYMSNTRSEVFLDIPSQQHFILLAGRWYRSESLKAGPWEYTASDALPANFSRIAPGSKKGHVLAFVAGTPEAEAAAADAQTPQIFAVSRKKARLDVTYEGEPKFSRIQGTDVEYAVNTQFQVLRIRDRYYACHKAAWFVSDSPDGPWKLADRRPGEVDQIPPDSPVYNVKYVNVYDSAPDRVYVGYTPGYTGTYLYRGSVVFGTGYTYPGYLSTGFYYPGPITWGVSALYDPWYRNWYYGPGFASSAHFGYYRGAHQSNWWHGSGVRNSKDWWIREAVRINNNIIRGSSNPWAPGVSPYQRQPRRGLSPARGGYRRYR